MHDLFLEYYSWIKALHFAAFICWMAALFYLPRLFVYHSENKNNLAYVDIVKIQERRLFRGIQTPAMFLAVLTGVIMLVVNVGLLKMPYIHAKLTLALILLLYHFDTWRYLKQLQNDRCLRSGRFFRVYNEVPTLLMIAILIVMVARPF